MCKRIAPVFISFVLFITLFIPVIAADAGSITVSGASGKAGDTVEIKLDLSGNPGLIAMRLFVSYEPSKIKLISAEDGRLFETAASVFGNDINALPYVIMWEDSLAAADNTADGTIAVLKFKIADNASGSAAVTVSYDQASTFDKNLKEAPLRVTNGIVTVNGGGSESCKHTNTESNTTEADCFVSGFTVKKCKDCGAALESLFLPVKGHSFGEWQVRATATQNSFGLEFRKCVNCGFEETQGIEKPGERPSAEASGNISNESGGFVSGFGISESEKDRGAQTDNEGVRPIHIIILYTVIAAAGLGMTAVVLLKKRKKHTLKGNDDL